MNTKQNFYKIIISVGFLIVVLSVSYYFVVYLPQKQERELILKVSKELSEQTDSCRRAGLELDIKYEPDEDSGGMLLNSRYKYDEKRKKCFYGGAYVYLNIISEYIIDVSTNEDIASYTARDEEVISGDKQVFEQVHKELFGD